jgi:tRNA threonylcarbamoyladenosine biosynthesis protein TsaB
MKLLAFDTSMAACSAAIYDGARVLAHRDETMTTGQAEVLAPMIAAIMKDAGLSFPALTHIAATTGPGTFTGVRIGLSMARGLGMSLGLPVIGINSLAALACNEPARDKPLAAIADARNNEFYASVFEDAPEPRIARREHLGDYLPKTPFRVLGSGADMIMAEFSHAERSHAGDVPVARNFAARAAGLDAKSHPPEPLYLRAPDIKPQHRIETLTHLNPASAALLAELHIESFPSGWSDQEFHKLFGAPGLEAAIVMHGTEPAGFALMRHAADEAEIIAICVRPKLRRKGFGKLLLVHAERTLRAQSIQSLFLEVSAKNTAARALYLRLGFIEAGKRPRYYNGNEDAIIMRKEL